MMKFKERLARFWQGRYGNDALSNFMMWSYLALVLVNLFFRSTALYFIAVILVFLTLFRMFSKNIGARNKENLKYLAVKKKFASFWKLLFDRARDCPKKVYKKCPSCKAIIRLPRQKGKHNVTCPSCRHRFSMRVAPFWEIVLIAAAVTAVVVCGVVALSPVL